MTRFKIGPQAVVSAVLAVLLFASVAGQSALAQVAPRPAEQPPAQPASAPAALSTNLSYYFISGNTFTPYAGSTSYVRQGIGCMNMVTKDVTFSAPVHLPQASQVVSVTVFTYDSVMTDTISTAQFVLNDGQGIYAHTLSASSAPQVAGYQHQQNTSPNPTTIDNQTYSYQVDWYKSGSDDSPLLGLCGVRLAYYAPLGATFIPVVEK